jgi:transposase
MFIKANKTKVRGAEYTNYLLVESVKTPKGPRQNVICSLGNLKPGPAEHWYHLAKKIERALAGQLDLEVGDSPDDEQVDEIVQKIRSRNLSTEESQDKPVCGSEQIDVDGVTVEEAREAGPVHVCHQMWLKLGIDRILRDLGFDERGCALTEMLTINRLVDPGSELATRRWVPQTALADILGKENCELGATTLYTQLDRLHPLRSQIETALVQAERDILKLSNSIFLYDLTSTYFEGQCLNNDQAQHGYSRDQRPDCKQVVVGLVLSGDRFPIAHEVFDGNRSDTTTLDEMLDILDARAGGSCKGRTIVVDRGMSSKENLATIRERGCHYIVATRQQERDEYLAEIESDEGWQKLFKVRKGKYFDTILNEIKIKRLSKESVAAVKGKKLAAAENRFKRAKRAAESGQDAGEDEEHCVQKSLAAVELLRELKNAADEARLEEQLIICISKGRTEKDRAIREKQEKKFLVDAKALVAAAGTMKPAKVHERIGRLKERYSRVARYYDFVFDEGKGELSISENADKKELAKELDGSYIIRTNRNDLTDLEVWQTYMMLTRVESAFRDMKSPLVERPIFHQLERRVQTHIFVCVLAYHLLALIEKQFRDRGISTSWETIRETLKTHQVVTVVMPCKGGRKVLRLRRGTTPERQHKEIYDVLGIPHEPMQPVKSWLETTATATMPAAILRGATMPT